MLMYIFYGSLGILYATAAYFIKQYAFAHKKILLDVFMTIIRYVALFFVLWYTLKNFHGNTVLLMISFISSYLVTLLFLIKRAQS